jgi:hypothetical protein
VDRGVSTYHEARRGATAENENVCARFRAEAEILGIQPPDHIIRMGGNSWIWEHLRNHSKVESFLDYKGPAGNAIMAYQQQVRRSHPTHGSRSVSRSTAFGHTARSLSAVPFADPLSLVAPRRAHCGT